EPLGESRSNVWLFGQLAQRMGFQEDCFRDTPEAIIRQALAIGADGHSTNANMEHITFEDLDEQGHMPLAFHADPDARPFLPYTRGPFATPTGKIELYSETLAAAGQDALPAMVAPSESWWRTKASGIAQNPRTGKNDKYRFSNS